MAPTSLPATPGTYTVIDWLQTDAAAGIVIRGPADRAQQNSKSSQALRRSSGDGARKQTSRVYAQDLKKVGGGR
jgi:hypothetical protein